MAGTERQNEWERQFRDGISPDHIRENMRRLSAHPHHVGSPYDRDNAEWILAVGAKPIAAVGEYMDERKWKGAELQVPQIAQVIENVAAGINQAAEDFENEIARR